LADDILISKANGYPIPHFEDDEIFTKM